MWDRFNGRQGKPPVKVRVKQITFKRLERQPFSQDGHLATLHMVDHETGKPLAVEVVIGADADVGWSWIPRTLAKAGLKVSLPALLRGVDDLPPAWLHRLPFWRSHYGWDRGPLWTLLPA